MYSLNPMATVSHTTVDNNKPHFVWLSLIFFHFALYYRHYIHVLARMFCKMFFVSSQDVAQLGLIFFSTHPYFLPPSTTHYIQLAKTMLYVLKLIQVAIRMVSQGCIISRWQIIQVKKLCMVASNICKSLIWSLLHVTLLELEILRLCLHF